MHGFRASGSGNPLDAYSRNVYLDTPDSAYGAGWKREKSFLAHQPNGNYCYGFYPHDPYPGYPPTRKSPAGNGVAYRLTAIGPGVTPVVAWQGNALPNFDRSVASLVAHESETNAWPSGSRPAISRQLPAAIRRRRLLQGRPPFRR